MLKPTVASMIALSLCLAALGCRDDEELSSTEEETQVPDTTELLPPDSLVETIGGDWIVRAQSGLACVSVPPSAIPEGKTLDVHIKQVPPTPPPFSGRPSYPPYFDVSVTDETGAPAQFADSVYFAICVNYGSGSAPSDMALARGVSADSIEFLRVVPVPRQCRLRCDTPSAETTAWLDGLLEGSPLTATPAHAAVETEGLGGKGRTTSPFAGVRRSGPGQEQAP